MCDTYLGGEVAACLELLQEGGHEDGGEEEDHAPEEDVGDVGAVGTTGAANKLPVKHLALLLAPEDTAIMMMSVMRIMMPIKMVRMAMEIMTMMDVGVSGELVKSEQSATFSFDLFSISALNILIVHDSSICIQSKWPWVLLKLFEAIRLQACVGVTQNAATGITYLCLTLRESSLHTSSPCLFCTAKSCENPAHMFLIPA